MQIFSASELINDFRFYDNEYRVNEMCINNTRMEVVSLKSVI